MKDDALRLDRMHADNFKWEASIPDGKTMHVVVTHKLSGRQWRRETTEGEWPKARQELLATIEKDLTPPFEAVPKQ